MTAHVDKVTRVMNLVDFLVKHPKGVTITQISKNQGVSKIHASSIIRELRDYLGEYDSINLPCDPDPKDPKGEYLYHLVGDYEGVKRWSTNRVLDTERRVRTQHSMMSSIVTASKGLKSSEAVKARLMKKSLGRLIEDLDDLESV